MPSKTHQRTSWLDHFTGIFLTPAYWLGLAHGVLVGWLLGVAIL